MAFTIALPSGGAVVFVGIAMTTSEWNTTDDVLAMIYAVGRKASDRRWYQFLLACCEATTPPLEIPSFRMAVQVVRHRIDGESVGSAQADAERAASDECRRWIDQHPNHQWSLAAYRLAAADFDPIHAWHVVLFLRQATSLTEIAADQARLSQFHADLVREIIGPWRKPRFLVRWRSETVRLLAMGIATDQAFDRLPILADALEEAGCDNLDLLNHCRGPGPHVRGCWVLDLVRNQY
jgi:hypothetical protein